nr:hypothetical protein [Saccharopolyspora sp. HNM0983]
MSCGNVDRAARPDAHGARWTDVGSRPGRQELDPVLAEATGRVVVHGTDADLAAVVLRLLRKDRLAGLEVGYVPAEPSPAARLWGVRPGDARHAFTASARPAPLIRDDSGGVLLGTAAIEPITGQVYCDDERVLNGPAPRLEVSPDPAATPLPAGSDPPADPAADGLRVAVLRRGLLRRKRDTTAGRAAQASFDPTTVVQDGVAHPRPADKWVWYRHTQDLLLVRGS